MTMASVELMHLVRDAVREHWGAVVDYMTADSDSRPREHERLRRIISPRVGGESVRELEDMLAVWVAEGAREPEDMPAVASIVPRIAEAIRDAVREHLGPEMLAVALGLDPLERMPVKVGTRVLVADLGWAYGTSAMVLPRHRDERRVERSTEITTHSIGPDIWEDIGPGLWEVTGITREGGEVTGVTVEPIEATPDTAPYWLR